MTPKDELREYIEDVLGIKYGSTALESAQIEQIEALISSEQLAMLDRLLKNGHGGGNYRRLIEVIRKEVEGEE